ncbi:MAG: hypothetical protein WD382_01520 [Halofilum sp. (in: g-proteobacteria)]
MRFRKERRIRYRFVFVNQGEELRTVERYLRAEQLELQNVVLDRASEIGRHFRSRGMPTTLFFNGAGERVDQHLGEVTRPQLREYLEDLTAG